MSELNILKNDGNQAGRRILITSGPTREYLDPVRFLSNASSGKMGAALAKAALNAGFEVVVVSGPVVCDYPPEVRTVHVTSTDEMLHACLREFPGCAGVIGAAAPCDYRPAVVSTEKIKKNGNGAMTVDFVETPDILAELGKIKRPDQWIVPFALETAANGKSLALDKLRRKNGDLIVLNGPQAMQGDRSQVEIFDRVGEIVAKFFGAKESVASQIIGVIQEKIKIDCP